MASTVLSSSDAITGAASEARQRAGAFVVRGASLAFVTLVAIQILFKAGAIGFGFQTWLPVLIGFALWSVALCAGGVLRYGEAGWRALFVLPAVYYLMLVVEPWTAL